MKLLLHLETASSVDAVLAAAYAFDPYAFKHIGNGTLEATIDASKDLTDAQQTIIATSKYEVTFVLPASSTPSPTTPAPTATGS